ncbi:MAG: hypothetical protein LBT83_06115 [Tannerella sp.]|jgi:hypothetical protein|nr:hypothetical protein [Tannerella sp.]
MKMVHDNIYNALLKEIRKRIPQNSKLVNTLVDILLIEKEAVYRRLRGEVPFTFHEIAVITKHLEISLDTIIGIEVQKSKPFQLILPDFVNPHKEDLMMIDTFIHFMKSIISDDDAEMVVISNILPQDLFPRFEYLSKLTVFKWYYHYYNDNQVKPFHEFTVPDIIRNGLKEQYLLAKNIKKTRYIFDNHLCEHVIKDVNYFSNIRLMDAEDIQKVKKELFQFLDYLKNLTVNGTFKETGNIVYIYVSDLDILTSYSYMRTKNIKFSLIKAFLLTSVTSMNEDTFEKMRSWIQSVIKTSTLITLANEKQRILFFERQWEIVNSL